MNLNELLQEVYNLTARPDLVAETKTAIKSATLKAHNTDFYQKDIAELYISAETKDYIHSIDYINIASNFRALKYLRKYDTETSEPGDFLTVITPEEVLDSYNSTRKDVVYVAGRVLQINSSTEINTLLMGCYVSPIITETGYSSWIAELYPYAIIYEAARVVFKTIGFDEQSAAYERLVAEEYATLKIAALADVGM